MSSSCFYYLIPEGELVYDMLLYAHKTLTAEENPSRATLIHHRNNLRAVVDVNTVTTYFIVKMGVDFSSAFKGFIAYGSNDLITELRNAKYAHNLIAVP